MGAGRVSSGALTGSALSALRHRKSEAEHVVEQLPEDIVKTQGRSRVVRNGQEIVEAIRDA